MQNAFAKSIRLSAGLIVVGALACTSGPNPKKDLKLRIESRMKQSPYFDLESVKKYVKEEKSENDREYYYQITYLTTKDCFFDAMNASGPFDVTLSLCSNKQLSMLSRPVRKGTKIIEFARISYTNNKVANVDFRSIHSLMSGFGELED